MIDADLYPTRAGGPARLLPRLDPVLASDTTGPLSRGQLADYECNGFVILPAVLQAADLDALARECGELESVDGPDERVIFERGCGAVRSVFAFHERGGALGALARHPALLGAARQILGEDVYVHQSRVNFKPALHGAGFYWHSDFETWHAEDGMPRMRALSVSVLLDANHAWNGPLMLLPGSHRTFVSCPAPTPPDHHRVSLVDQEVGTPSAAALRALFDAAGRIEVAVGPPGTAVLFDCNTLHASGANLSPVPRRNAFLVYNAATNRLVAPFGAPRPRPAFLAHRDPSPTR